MYISKHEKQSKITSFGLIKFKVPVVIARAMAAQSLKIPGCHHNINGSSAHFAQTAVLEKLERCGLVWNNAKKEFNVKSAS